MKTYILAAIASIALSVFQLGCLSIPTSVWYGDTDGDGYGAPNIVYLGDNPPAGYVKNKADCDDSDGAINPDATEVADGVDNNCNGQVDESVGPITWYLDNDSDSYGDPNISVVEVAAPAGYVADNSDCDDNNGAINPWASEIFDSVDNDCDGDIDGGFVQTPWYADADVDGYGDSAVSQMAVLQPAGYVADDSDCDDTNAAVNPAATEVVDGIDNNCDGNIDIDVDTDGDSVFDGVDNCPAVSNLDQADNYGTSAGDACEDTDGDGTVDASDPCPEIFGIDPVLCTCVPAKVDVTYDMMDTYYQLTGTPFGLGDGDQPLGTSYHDGSSLDRTMTIRYTDSNADGLPDNGPAWIVQMSFGVSFATEALGDTVFTEIDVSLPDVSASGAETDATELTPGLLTSLTGGTVAGLELTGYTTEGWVYCPAWEQTSNVGLVCASAGAGPQSGSINPDFAAMTVSGFGVGTGTLTSGIGQVASVLADNGDGKMSYAKAANVFVHLTGVVRSIQLTAANAFCN